MRIYLADLGHNQLTLSSDVYPLGVANLAAYAQKYFPTSNSLDIHLFREPEDLKSALDSTAPDILGLSSYAWNHELSLHFAHYAKIKTPNVLTLLGGPNFPLTTDEQESFLRSLSYIDAAVRGPTYESERAFLNIIQRFHEVQRSIEGLQEESVPGNMWINRKTGAFIKGNEVDRILDLDEIPSPYLGGWMDPFFRTGYFPMMQISRGCPFQCTFCNSAVVSNNKVNRHSVENIKADLYYIAKRIRPEIALCFADDNFGMYSWDEEVADYIAYLQDEFHWPQYIRTTTGKNKQERILRVMKKTRASLPMTAAVQSMDPDVLKNIERSNIKLETYTEIQKEVQKQGMQSYGELILCLPGETKKSFMKGIKDLLDAGVSRVSAHQLMLLHGAPLSNPESRTKWGLKTQFRVVARNIGNYTGTPIIEVEEIVVETPTFSFQEYLETRVFHLLLTIFYYENNFEEPFRFAQHYGIKPFEIIVCLESLLAQAPQAFKSLIDDFIRESKEQLFPSKEECLAWALENFDALVSGTVGGNELSKYSMLGRFYLTTPALEFLEMGLRKSLGVQLLNCEDTDPLGTIMSYLKCILLHVPFNSVLSEHPQWTSWYDIEAWQAEGFNKPLKSYQFPQMKCYSTVVDPDRAALIKSRISAFGEHPSGLGKFTRTMFAKELRRSLVPL